jgi:hypothetical protein
MVWR